MIAKGIRAPTTSERMRPGFPATGEVDIRVTMLVRDTFFKALHADTHNTSSYESSLVFTRQVCYYFPFPENP